MRAVVWECMIVDVTCVKNVEYVKGVLVGENTDPSPLPHA